MFSGMSLRMARDLGLHRKRSPLGTSIERSPANLEAQGGEGILSPVSTTARQSHVIDLESFERSAQITLFWCIFAQDTCLSNGTGRVPTVKRDDISIPLVSDMDMAIVQAGPSGIVRKSRPYAFVQLIRMMQCYAPALELLNTDSAQEDDSRAPAADSDRLQRLEKFKYEIHQNFILVPKELRLGAIYYRETVRNGEAGPYLIMHFYYHLFNVFLTQESLAVREGRAKKMPDASVSRRGVGEVKQLISSVEERQPQDEIYRNAVTSIVDLLTFVKLIDDKALLTTFFLNQTFFHAACAYIRDMLEFSTGFNPKDRKPSAFPIPSRTSPSVVTNDPECRKSSIPSTASRNSRESTHSYLSLVAKTKYQFLRQSVKDINRLYAGGGWVDAVLDQREQGLRDVDLSHISDSISTFIRLHDLRGREGSGEAVKDVSSRRFVKGSQSYKLY